MKIKGTGGPTKTSKTAPTKKNDERDAAVDEFVGLMGASSAEDTQSAAATGATGSIASLDALLMAQEVDDPAQRQARQRMRKRSNKILDALESIRNKMLHGRLTIGDMIDVADVVASHREKIEDPHLNALMDEVDLRAQVEIAKMRVAMDKAAKEAGQL